MKLVCDMVCIYMTQIYQLQVFKAIFRGSKWLIQSHLPPITQDPQIDIRYTLQWPLLVLCPKKYSIFLQGQRFGQCRILTPSKLWISKPIPNTIPHFWLYILKNTQSLNNKFIIFKFFQRKFNSEIICTINL